LKTRRVTVHKLRIRHPELVSGSIVPPASKSSEWMLKQVQHDGVRDITLSATVSKGTYIRSLARDIAIALNSRGHVTMLRRTRAGPFGLEAAISLDFLDEAAKARTLDEVVLPLRAGLDDIPALPVTPDEAQLLRHGQRLCGKPVSPGLYLATDDVRPVALVEVSDSDVTVVRGFNI
jgi:tRNA pseudouridine55 synthase